MGMRKVLAGASVVSMIAVSGTILGATSAAAGSGGACPNPASAFSRWDVATEPYQADNASDFNGNGWVCARPTKDTFVENGQTFRIYLFIDDSVRT
ncbi:MAG: hypothetical protein QOE25_763 [Actinomycetota bacterium]|jgi:hypothetical protein|nr:hypothetical protein [Actinomycetota bacterium]